MYRNESVCVSTLSCSNKNTNFFAILLSQLITNKMSEIIQISNLKYLTDEDKSEFITKIVSSSNISTDFKAQRRTAEKIFFESINGVMQKREWLLFSNGHFFCVYCVCFSSCSTNQFVIGVEFNKNRRIVECIIAHNHRFHHGLAKNSYLGMIESNHEAENLNCPENRNALTCIVKIIIFIATHG